MTFNREMVLQAHDISKNALEILALCMPFRATMNSNCTKIREPNDECINIKVFGSILIQEQQGMVQSIVTMLRGSQRRSSFKLAGRQHVYQKHQNILRKGCSKISKRVTNICKAMHRSIQTKRVI